MKLNLYSSLKRALLLLLAAPTILSAQAGEHVDVQIPVLSAAMPAMVTDSIAGLPQPPPPPPPPQPPHFNQERVTAAEALAPCEPALAAEVAKVIEWNYKVGSSDLLSIENKFGKVHVNTWKRNEIHVKVNIICRAGSEQVAQQMLDMIRIQESRDGKNMLLRTEMEPMRINNNNSGRNFEINYTVSMPEDNPLTIKNSFGDVYLANFRGISNINLRYGSLKTEQMNNVSNTLKVAYGSVNCRYINQGSIDLAYGSINVDGTNGLQGSSSYSDFKIGSLNNTLNLKIKYGSLRVDKVSKHISKINVTSGFTPIALTFEDNTTFNFDVNVQFGDFKFDKNLVNVTSLEKSHTSASYKGSYGNASSKASVNIVSRYDDVKFYR